MKQFVLDYLSNQLSISDRVARCQLANGENDLMVTLSDGKRIGMCVINHAVRVTEIRDHYANNTRKKIHTLYIIDGRMVPADNAEVKPPQWMSALHTLTVGRVYAYWCDGRDVTIKPLHLEWKWGGSPRGVEYGSAIEVGTLRAGTVQTATKDIDGEFAVAYFGEGTFWKQAQSADEAQFDYSWRNWSFGGTRRNTAQEERTSSGSRWDPWEEFQRHYSETGSSTNESWQWASSGSEQARRTQRTASTVSRYYAILGVPMTASIDEVKQAYRQMARAYHPDMHPTEKDKYTAKMADINTAFEAIMKAQR